MNNLYFCIMKNNRHPVLEQITLSLKDLYPQEEVKSISKIICEDLLGLNYLSLYLDKDIIISDKQKKDLISILNRLKNFEPIQYLVKEVQFMGQSFFVDYGVLIPRPETEYLVELILKKESRAKKLLDIGTGSGCIAISLAKGLPESSVDAWEISEKAIQIAQRNNKQLKAGVNIEKRDVFQPSFQNNLYDVIVSNPPYITEKEKESMEPNVLKWEPNLALFVPNDKPLLYYEQIAKIAQSLLRKSGVLYFEINSFYGKEVVSMLEGLGYLHIELIADLYGNDRFIRAEL